MMIQRQKRARITPETKGLIFERALEQPRIPRTALAEKLQVEIKGRKEDVPDLAVLERMISHYRNHAEDDPQDKPWDFRALNTYPLPTESLPAVIESWMILKRRHGLALSIRQAKWVSWLYPFYKKREMLVDSALFHSWIELLEKMIGSSGFDWQILNIVLYKMISGEKITEKEALEKILREPITGFGVQYTKTMLAEEIEQQGEQKKAKGAKK
jgi:hypothetical protein